MKKEEFLSLLREKISILKKEEQDDIINEYEEHIEEKLKKKKKEEKIIEELGNVDDIAKEILDAYKINDEYTNKKSGLNFLDTCNKVINKIVEKFSHKSFGEIIKFILEILVIILLIAILKLPFLLIESLGSNMFNSLFSPVGNVLEQIWTFLIELCYLVVAFFVFINIFKVRYLSDDDVKDIKKSVKKNTISKKTEVVVNKPVKEQVNAINTGASILYSFLKVILVMMGIPFIFSLIFLLVSLGIIIFVGFESNFFFGLLLCDLSLIIGNLWLLDIIYKIIFDKPFKGFRVFFTIIAVIVGFSLGVLLSIYEFSRIEMIEGNDVLETSKYEKDITLSSDVKTNVYCYECSVHNQIVKIDNTLNNKAKIEVEYYKDIEGVKIDDETPYHYMVYSKEKFKKNIDLFFENLKDNKILNYNEYDDLKVTVYINSKDLNKINFANNKFYMNGIYQGNPNEIDY